MPLPKDKAWFPVKTYGYGWGLPCRWQGWVVMIGFLVALFAGSPLVSKLHALWFVAYALVLAGILSALCYWKGEKPGWRWGDNRD
jgi:hypothetical protein